MADEDEKLKKLAIEEILRETRRAAVRANEVGSLGWRKCPLPSTNKRFIRNTLLSTLNSVKRPKIIKDSPKDKRKEVEETRSKQEKDEECTNHKEKSSAQEYKKQHSNRRKRSIKEIAKTNTKIDKR